MEQRTATWGMKPERALFLAALTMFLWLVVPVTAARPVAAQTVQAGDGSVNFDFFIYLDNSSTIFSDGGGPNAPSRRIAAMLQKLLESPFDDRSGRPFATTGDRIHLYRFDATVRPFGDPIDGGDRNAWRTALEQFGLNQQKTGTDRGPEVNPSKTNFVSLFRSIAEQPELQDTVGNRRQLVIIASDFVHDPNNNSGEVCAAARAYQLDKSVVPAKADMTLLASRTEQKLLATGMKPFFVNLEYDVLTPQRQGEPQWVTCNRDMMRTRPLTQALEADSRIKAANILFSQVADDTERFVQEIRDSVYRAMLPPLTLRSGTLQLTGGQLTLSLGMENRGRVDNLLRRASVYGRASDAATAALAETGRDFAPRTVRSGQVETLEIPLGGTVNPALYRNPELFVSWSDDSAASAATPRRFPIRFKDEEPFELTNAARETSDPTRVTLTVRNSQGGAKSVDRIAFREGPTATTIILDSPDRGLVQPNQSLTIPSLPIPAELLRRIRAGGFELAVESGATRRTSAWTSIRPVSNLAPVQVEPLPWTPQSGGNSLLLTAKLSNPNPFDVQVSRFVFLDGGSTRLRQDCAIAAAEGLVEAGQSREMSCQIPTRELANRSELTMRAADTRGEFLSGTVRLPSIRNNPLQLLSAKFDLQQPGALRVVAVVRNPDSLPNSVRSLIISQKRWLPSNTIRLTPTDADRQISFDSGNVEIGATLQPSALSSLDLNALQLRVVDLVPETEQTSPFVNLDTTGVVWPTLEGQHRLTGSRLDIDVIGQNSVPLTPLEVRLSASPSGESSTTVKIKERLATTENQRQSLWADITLENQLALLTGSDVYACISSVGEFVSSATASVKPCNMVRIVSGRPKANIVVGLDRSQNGIAYTPEPQGPTSYQLRIALTNRGDWAGRVTGITLLPPDTAQNAANPPRQALLPLEFPVVVPAMQTVNTTVRLSAEQWRAYVSDGTIRYDERAITTEQATDGTPVIKNDLLERMGIELKATWIQSRPGASNDIVVGIMATFTRQNDSSYLKFPVTLLITNNDDNNRSEKERRYVEIGQGSSSENFWFVHSFHIEEKFKISSSPRMATILIPGHEPEEKAIIPSSFSHMRANISIGIFVYLMAATVYTFTTIKKSRNVNYFSKNGRNFGLDMEKYLPFFGRFIENNWDKIFSYAPSLALFAAIPNNKAFGTIWFVSTYIIALAVTWMFVFRFLRSWMSRKLESKIIMSEYHNYTIPIAIGHLSTRISIFTVSCLVAFTILHFFAFIPIEVAGTGGQLFKFWAYTSEYVIGFLLGMI